MSEKLDFQEFLEKKRSWYKKIGKVFCPVLNEWVIFNAKGFYHLQYDGTGSRRAQEQRIYRMYLLEFSQDVVQSSAEIVDYRKQYSKSAKKEVEYWTLKKLVSDRKAVIVILRRIGTGNIIFYSIWRDKLKKPSLE